MFAVIALAKYRIRSIVIEIPKRVDEVLKESECFREFFAVRFWIELIAGLFVAHQPVSLDGVTDRQVDGFIQSSVGFESLLQVA